MSYMKPVPRIRWSLIGKVVGAILLVVGGLYLIAGRYEQPFDGAVQTSWPIQTESVQNAP